MKTTWHRWLALACVASGAALLWACVPPADAQFRLGDWFNGKSTQQAKAKTEDSNRLMEIFIELAWLADPVTFPYFLEARASGASLEVRGFVPNKAVREKALNIARVHCPLKVVDAMKEHGSLAVPPASRSPEQLKNAVQTALREAFPKHYQNLQVQCFPGGMVQVSGTVMSYDQKLAVSQSLRRLHGCTSINNVTQVASAMELAQAPVKRTNPSEVKDDRGGKKGLFGWFAKSNPSTDKGTPKASKSQPDKGPNLAKTGPAGGPNPIQPVSTTKVKPGEPYETRGTVVITEEPKPAAQAQPNQKQQPSQAKTVAQANPPQASKQPLASPKNTSPSAPVASGNVAQLKKRLEAAVPGRDVQVTMLPNNGVRVEVRPRPGEDSGQLAGQIFSLPELEPYGDRVELHFLLPNEK